MEIVKKKTRNNYKNNDDIDSEIGVVKNKLCNNDGLNTTDYILIALTCVDWIWMLY